MIYFEGLNIVNLLTGGDGLVAGNSNIINDKVSSGIVIFQAFFRFN